MAPRHKDPVHAEARPKAAEPAEPDVSSDVLQAQLDEARGRAEGYFQNWQRAAADFQNYKRRMEAERQQNALHANLALLMNILPAYDDLERALDNLNARPPDREWAEGIRQIARKFRGALEASGLREIPAEGEDFDPRVHEAIAEAVGEAGKVVRAVQKGYMLGDRIIRPAMVIVGSGKNQTGGGGQ